ncbi:hypothetical protein [Gordonia polyisoprenivorans]|uniref:hypothetical protein n=1 Tax=Gordonia polyisoprenivorans TaxID=84595 RepID=UPI001AD64B71|nr:hypothetical protein [Gordonia polyisoprenivorans]QTI68784.1 hypothetical protein J6U32_25555 [Gordonia polyisoprenivorans]
MTNHDKDTRRPTTERPSSERLGPERLGTDDDLFIRMEHALGLGVINQGLWRFDGRLDPDVLSALATRLRYGRLSRLARRRPPPVRDRWHYTPAAGMTHFEDEPVAEGDAVAWARRQAERGVDSVAGPAWRLTAAYSADRRTTFVSLIAAHAVADGWSMVTAVEEAVLGTDYAVTTERVGALDDVVDGVRTAARAARAAGRLIAGTVGSRRGPTPTGPVRPPGLIAEDPCGILLSIPADDYARAFARAQGSANALFVAIMVGLLAEAGIVGPDDVVPVSIPVSMHPDGDRRANATTGTTAQIRVSDDRYHDLTAIRAACKEAYRSVHTGTSTMGHLSQVAQALGDRPVRRLAANGSTPMCLASNLGELSPEFCSLGSGLDAEIAVRAFTGRPAGTADFGGGVSGWFGVGPRAIGLAVTSLDPRLAADDAALAVLVRAELKRWELEASEWGE